VGKRELLNSFEKLLILRVGARPAALNNVDTDFVELLSYRKLIVQGEGYASSLGAVAESRVKNFNVIDSTTPAEDSPTILHLNLYQPHNLYEKSDSLQQKMPVKPAYSEACNGSEDPPKSCE
jgi:hypothetical protein